MATRSFCLNQLCAELYNFMSLFIYIFIMKVLLKEKPKKNIVRLVFITDYIFTVL